MVSIFTYGFPVAAEAFEKAGVPLVSLTDYPALIETAKERGMLTDAQLSLLLKWRQDPAGWDPAL
jgi:orotate phosphoribosyltransferase